MAASTHPEKAFKPIKYTQLFINGEFVDSIGGHKFATVDPASELTITHVSEAREEDVNKAVDAAAAAFEEGSEWRNMAATGRAALLHALADTIEEHGDEMAEVEAWDTGKGVGLAKAVDVGTAVKILRYYAGWTDKIESRVLPSDSKLLTYTRYQPLGVVAAILPFNFPMLGAVCKLAPALAAGNTIVLKSAEKTPLGTLLLAALVQKVGFPKGVVNILSGYGPSCGGPLVAHPRVAKVTFTGSNAVGKAIQKVAADTLKRVTLELGGKNACIILEDADLETAVRIACGGNYFNAGQICVGITRVFVPEGMRDAFLAKAVAKASARTLGDQWSGAEQGPLADEAQMNRVLRYIDVGVKEGAKLVVGGKRHGDKGYFVQPTIFSDVTDDMTIAKEEIFGPVMSVLTYKTVDEAVKRANATPFGLAATIITSNPGKAIPIANRLDTGTVWINTHGVFDAPAPYGGFKQSGVGREYGLEGLLPYLETKTVMMAMD